MPQNQLARFIVSSSRVAALLGGAIALLSACTQRGGDNPVVSAGRGAPLVVLLPRPPTVTDPMQMIAFFSEVLRDERIVGPLVLPPFGPPGTAGERIVVGTARTARRRTASSRCRSTSSRRRTSTRTARSGATRATSAATARLGDRGAAGREPLQRSRSATTRRATAAWGYCDRDYPREAIVSPYPFKTAQAHYEALLAETREARRPDASTPYATVPGEWTGPLRGGSGVHDGHIGVLGTGMLTQPDADDPVAADARVSDAHGAGGCITRATRTRRSGRRSTAGPKASCAAGTSSPARE